MNPGLFDRHKIAMKHAGQPHCMKIQVCYDNREVSIQQILCYQMRNDAGRHEMGADRDMRIELTNELYQGTRVQTIEHEAHAVSFPRFIALLVPPSEEFRSVPDQARIKLRVKVAE